MEKNSENQKKYGRLIVRLSKEKIARIDSKAKEAGLNRSDSVRKFITGI